MQITTLVIGYNRPKYLSEVLKSLDFIKDISNEFFISIDKETDNEKDIELVKESLEISKKFLKSKKNLIIQNKKLGCKNHIKTALKYVLKEAKNDFILVLEDDIVLIDVITKKRIEDYILNYENDKMSVLKLRQYFCGWLIHKDILTILLDDIDDIINEYSECNYEAKKLKDFNKKYNNYFRNINEIVLSLEPFKLDTYIAWDSEFALKMIFRNIKEIKDNNNYANNIGIKTSIQMNLEINYSECKNINFYVKNGKPILY